MSKKKIGRLTEGATPLNLPRVKDERGAIPLPLPNTSPTPKPPKDPPKSGK